MNVRTDHHRTRAALAAAAISASVLAATAACAGSSTATTASGGVTTTSAPATSAGTVSLPAASSPATTAAGTTATAAGTRAAAAGGTAACANADVTVTVGTGDAAMSHDAQVLKFTNGSSHTCTLRGYPGAAVVGGGRTLLNATRQLNGYVGDERQLSSAPTVILAPGQTASAVLEWEANAGEKCYSNGSGNLVVTPPNTTESTSLRAVTVGSGGVCAGFEIHPVVPGVISG
ncbi:MAG TPA: DUF4232 domain-containing protein [Actinospica sp.]|jgi:hypothetical protein|nr:DUF4232 domain-containing protein [Actinospica sp.]